MWALLAALLAQPVNARQPPANPSSKQEIAALPLKTRVSLQLTDGTTERGRIMSHADADFILRPDSGGGKQTIPYPRVRSVELIQANHSKTKWIAIGAVAGAAATVAIIAAIALHHPFTNVGHL